MRRINSGTLRSISLNKTEYFETSEIQKKIRKGFSDLLSGEIKVYNLIVDGAVSDNSTVFYDRQGKVWPGPVHFHPTNGWMAGARHTSEPHSILTKRIVPNMLVQDFRNVAEVEKNQVDLRAIENLFPSVNKLFSKFVKDNLDVALKANFYFLRQYLRQIFLQKM